jgi:hypothetical protein
MRQRVQEHEVDILVGTQMAAGQSIFRGSRCRVITADGALYSTDFRAAEKLPCAANARAGRAGRGEAAGEVPDPDRLPGPPAVRGRSARITRLRAACPGGASRGTLSLCAPGDCCAPRPCSAKWWIVFGTGRPGRQRAWFHVEVRAGAGIGGADRRTRTRTSAGSRAGRVRNSNASSTPGIRPVRPEASSLGAGFDPLISWDPEA